MASLPVTLPTGRDGRILAGLLALLAVAAVWLGVVMPVLDWYDGRAAALLQLRQKAARETALIAALPALKKAAAAASQTPSRAVLTGSTDAIAGAALQEQVQAMASAASAQLTSIETLPAEQEGAYRRIGVRVELNAQLPVVVALLKSIEEAEPSMLVDDVHLTGTPVMAQNAQLPLDSSFTVYAFRVGTAKDAAE
jgi:general secretion pathway protein M